MSKKYYKVEEKNLLSLLEDSARLNAYDCAGVDNWDGCNYAFDQLEEEGYNSYRDVAKDMIADYEEL